MIIGITGRAGAGKDTFAAALRDYGKFATFSFAAPLKTMISTLLGTDYELWNDREWKETVIEAVGYSPRVLAQRLGTEWGRDSLDPDFWVRMGMRRAEETLKALGPGWHLAFTDCRFENEANAIRSRGGRIVHIERPGSAAATKSQHVSELQLPRRPDDWIVANDGTVEDLEQSAMRFADYVQLVTEANETV